MIPEIQYSVVEGVWSGLSVFNVDPLFADEGGWDDNHTPNEDDDIWWDGDYHLQSQAGRYDQIDHTWEKDNVTSPCIDAGNPILPWLYEPVPHGDRINIGLYGGTSQASLSLESF